MNRSYLLLTKLDNLTSNYFPKYAVEHLLMAASVAVKACNASEGRDLLRASPGPRCTPAGRNPGARTPERGLLPFPPDTSDKSERAAWLGDGSYL